MIGAYNSPWEHCNHHEPQPLFTNQGMLCGLHVFVHEVNYHGYGTGLSLRAGTRQIDQLTAWFDQFE